MKSPDVLTKLSSVVGSSTPGRGAWSLHVAVSCPSEPPSPIWTGAPGALSATSNERPNVCVCATPARCLPGMRPLSGPLLLAATRLPAALLVLELALTASYPSTLPALRAYETAATLVPPSETKSAIDATTMDGDGLVKRMVDPLRSVCTRQHNPCRPSKERRRQAGASQSHRPACSRPSRPSS